MIFVVNEIKLPIMNQFIREVKNIQSTKEFFVLPSEFSFICRTCLSKNKTLLPLKEQKVMEIFSQVTKLEIGLDDRLPQGICPFCINIFENVNNFIEVCRASDEILHLALNKNDASGNSCQNPSEEYETTLSPDNNSNEDLNYEEPTKALHSEKNEIKGKGENEDILQQSEPLKEYLECQCCHLKFDKKNELREHYIQNGICRENRFKCNICSKIFSKRFKLQAHVRCHTKETPFQCQICFKAFRFSQNLRRHRKTHEGIKPFVCHICNKGFSRAFVKEEHIRTHTGETPFICNYCGKSFKRYNSHRTHVIRHQMESGEIPDHQKIIYEEMKCNKCNKRFSTKSALRTHEILHTGEQKFLCNDCGKKFYTKGALQSHFKVHTGIKPYKCSSCDKSFSQKSGLKNHVLIHMGLKPYTCNLCSKSFVQSTHLKNHMRTHSGEKPYICSYCNKGFALNCNLKVHVRTHTGETPFRCSICDIGFYDSSSLKKHEKGHMTVSNPKKELQ